jgi:hypothetical protein
MKNGYATIWIIRGRRVAATLGVLVALFLAGMALTFLPSNDGVAGNVADSLALIEGEGDYPQALGLPPLDNYTDRILVQAALKPDGMGSLKAAMYAVGRPHYWYGDMVFVRPLLRVTDLNGIRYVNMFVFLSLLAFAAYCVGRRLGGLMAGLFAAALCFGHALVVPLSMQFQSAFVIMMAAVILVCVRIRRLPFLSGWNLFLIVGAFTSFFDLLTAPLLTLGMPLLVLLLVRRKEQGGALAGCAKEAAAVSLSWLCGYAVIWVSKWAIASAVLKTNIFALGKSKILERTAGVGHEEFNISRGQALAENIKEMFPPSAVAMLVAIVAVLLVLSVVFRKPKADFVRMLPLLAVAAFPYLWYLVLADHSQIHAWFTYRAQIISVFAVLGYLGYGIHFRWEKEQVS